MNDRIADTKHCPYCRTWIAMPLRRQREAFNAHTLQCRAEIPGAVIVPSPSPTFSPDCGLCGADIAAEPFHMCVPICECGRGPILQGNGSPDCCLECVMDRPEYVAALEMLETAPRTVKRVDLFGNVIDSFRTESELNGWKPIQGRMI